MGAFFKLLPSGTEYVGFLTHDSFLVHQNHLQCSAICISFGKAFFWKCVLTLAMQEGGVFLEELQHSGGQSHMLSYRLLP